MWLGRFKAGDFLPLLVASENPKTGAPVQPTSQVHAVISKATGAAIAVIPLTIKDRFSGRWVFQRLYLMGAEFTAGLYAVEYSWLASGTPYAALATFEIVSGSEGNGPVIALQSTLRPESVKVLYETGDGKLKLGRNPA